MKTIIFDFDGTLVDSELLIIESIRALKLPQLENVNQDQLKQFKNLGWSAALKQLRIPLYQLPSIVLRAQKEMSSRIEHISMVSGIYEVIKNLSHQGFTLGILTSNSVANVHKLLVLNNLNTEFKFIHSERNLFGKDKAINHLIKKYRLRKDQIIYIGDEVRDVEACARAGIEMVGVEWGFDTLALLQQAGLSKVVKTPSELLAYLSG